MLVFLARLTPDLWATFNRLKPDGVFAYTHSGCIVHGDTPDNLDHFSWSGLYKDVKNGYWIIQHVVEVNRSNSWTRVDYYRCWKTSNRLLSKQDQKDIQEMIDNARQLIRLLIGNVDDDEAIAVWHDLDIAIQGYHTLLAVEC